MVSDVSQNGSEVPSVKKHHWPQFSPWEQTLYFSRLLAKDAGEVFTLRKTGIPSPEYVFPQLHYLKIIFR